jgi:biopolymer transport protein ExbD
MASSRMKRARARRAVPHTELMLAAMVDIMVNLLIFLLHLYGTAPIETDADGLEVPDATARDPIELAPVVVVSRAVIEVDGKPLVTFAELDGELSYPEGVLDKGQIPGLYDWLAARKAALVEQSEDGHVPDAIVLECDRRLPWTVLEPVLATAGAAGFPRFRFVVNTVSAPSENM